MKLKEMACYLTNWQIDDQSAEERTMGHHRDRQRLGLGFGEAAVEKTRWLGKSTAQAKLGSG